MKRVITSLMLLVTLLAGTLVQPVGSAAAPRIRRWTIAPGVKYIRKVYPGIPLRVHIVRIDPSAPSTLDTMLATNTLPGKERTTSMAKRSGALVAINGDFGLPSGRPVHLFGTDGRLDQTALSYGRNFSMARDETQANFGHPRQRVFATELDGLLEHQIGRVNDGPPRYREMVMYTPESAGLLEIPKNTCAARLYPMTKPSINAEGVPEARYQVDAVRCSERTPLRREGGTVLIARREGTRADEFAFPYITRGEEIQVGWTLDWPNVADSIGGNPIIINDGKIPWDELSGPDPFLGRNPRTGVGATADGQVILMVVDGRWRRGSVGVSLANFAKLFRDHGAVWALNLDGGGSSTLVVNGSIVNRPSDGSERYVSSALVLLPGADPGEPTTDPQPDPEPDPSVEDPLLLTDPASTGGLSSYLVSRDRDAARSLERFARTFEATSRSERIGR